MVNFNFKLPIEKGTLIEGALMNYVFTRDVITNDDNHPARCILDFGGVALHLELITHRKTDAHIMDPNPYKENHHEETQIKMFVKHYDFLSDILDEDYNNTADEEEFIDDSLLDSVWSRQSCDIEEVEVTILRLMHRLKTRTLPKHVMLFNDGSTGCQTI